MTTTTRRTATRLALALADLALQAALALSAVLVVLMVIAIVYNGVLALLPRPTPHPVGHPITTRKQAQDLVRSWGGDIHVDEQYRNGSWLVEGLLEQEIPHAIPYIGAQTHGLCLFAEPGRTQLLDLPAGDTCGEDPVFTLDPHGTWVEGDGKAPAPTPRRGTVQ